jgi:hypothetical protein
MSNFRPLNPVFCPVDLAPEAPNRIQELVPPMVSRLPVVLALAVFLAASALPGRAQQPGPMTPLPGKEVKRVPATPGNPEPPVPAEEIIRKFTAHEDEFLRAHQNYTFHRTLRLQEFPADGSAGGELNLEEDIILAPNGKRYERGTKKSAVPLKNSQLYFDELKELSRFPLFPLTTDEVSRYKLTYVGAQPLDELNTYVFRVQPKQIERTRKQLEGLIYVDDHDLAIVKVYGRWITEVDRPEGALPFVMFDVQRESVDGKFWFPDYVRSEDSIPDKAGPTRLRLTIKMTDFKLGVSSPEQPPPAAPAPPA